MKKLVKRDKKQTDTYLHSPDCTIFRIWDQKHKKWILPSVVALNKNDGELRLYHALDKDTYNQCYRYCYVSPYIRFYPHAWKWKFFKSNWIKDDANKLTLSEQMPIVRLMAEVENNFRDKNGIPLSKKELVTDGQRQKAHILIKRLGLKKTWRKNLPPTREAYRRFIIGLEAIVRHQEEKKVEA